MIFWRYWGSRLWVHRSQHQRVHQIAENMKSKQMKGLNMGWIPVFLLLFGHWGQLKGQVQPTKPDTLQVVETTTDTTAEQEEKRESIFKVLFRGKPGRALMWSAIPGGGQVYNRRFWKVPIVYAGIGAAVYIIARRRENYHIYDEAFRMRVDLGDDSKDRFQGVYDVNTLQTFRREADKALFESYVWLGLIYVASGIEAFVDRHLMEFDISDDLSIELLPSNSSIATVAPTTPFSANIGLRYRF